MTYGSVQFGQYMPVFRSYLLSAHSYIWQMKTNVLRNVGMYIPEDRNYKTDRIDSLISYPYVLQGKTTAFFL